ncbi:MAG: penicillin-insensitive murein endopeptidase [Actinomycetota bacterium]
MLESLRARRRARACCPACAASVGHRRHAGIHEPLHRRAWLALVAVVAALVPLAAWDDSGGSLAIAAEPSGIVFLPPPPPVEESSAEDVQGAIAWHASVAHGTPNAGWLEGGVRLPIEGVGFYTYNPITGRPPGGADRRFGTEALVRQLLALGRWWEATYPDAPRLGIGDLSRPEGGPFRDAHASHQNGLDVDIRLPRRDGVEGPSNPGNYDRARTQAIVDRAFAQGASLVLVGPHLDITGPVTPWPNHDDHLHIRFPDPDGAGN